MASLIPELSVSDFKRLKASELKELKSCEVYSDGEYLFTFINAQTDFIKSKAEYMGQLSNAVGGKTMEQIKEAVLA